jgi:molybdenum cofactor cytidylyltransferase
MPFIRPETVGRVVAALADSALVAPYYQGRRGHPVGFGRRYFSSLVELAGDVGAQALLVRDAPLLQRLAVDDSGVVRDIDLPADLQRSC